MKYFETLIPQIIENQNTYFDMFFNFDINDNIREEFLTTYILRDGDTLKDVAYYFYDEPRLYWLVALTNNIKDPFFDIAKSNEYIQKEAVENATINPDFWTGDDSDLFWTGIDLDLFWYDQADFLNEYDILSEENEGKRELKIIKPEYLSNVVAEIIRGVNNV